MEKIMPGAPEYMKAFKPVNDLKKGEFEWDSWSALYQPDGGSVNMQESYNSLLEHIRGKVTIRD